MSRYQPYHLIKRKTKKGKILYQARFLDEESGKVICTRSTGQSNKTAAARIAERMIPEVQAQLAAESVENGTLTVSEYAKEYFYPGGPYECSRTERGYTVGRKYLEVCEGLTRNHIIPLWGSESLKDLTPGKIDRTLLKLFRSGKVKGATANKVLKTFRLILEGAVREELLEENPASYVDLVKETKKERGIFSRAEIMKLFRSPDLWPDFRHYALNLTAFTTGMRLGELRGLCIQNVHRNYISVRTQWEDNVGLKPPKAASIRDIPLPAITAKALHMLIVDNRPREILFYSKEDKSKPVTKSHMEKTLYQVMQKAGITAEERKRRNLVFHSWRHTLNTMLRAEGISDAKVQKITGHRSGDMTENYTHFQAEDYRDVSELTGRILLS